MPKPVSFTHTGTLGAPIDRVFALLSEPARFPDWLPNCRTVAPKDGAMKVGSRFHFEMGGSKNRVEIEIIDFQPTRTLGWVEHRRRTGSKVFIKLDYQGGATAITIRYVWQPRSFRSWLLGQVYRRRDAWRMFNGTLQNLRKALLK